ncbi:phage tail tube protein [Phenylobacterium sp.]|uniref:phage tail tube protein n=1 Tax=Phenylobacterium sp. TaxID=1871053 RepID=UPI00392C4247
MGAVSGLKLLLKMGDGASPEQFTAACSITAKTVNFEGQENTFDIPDCNDPEAISWLVSEMASKRVTIEGSGTLNSPDFDSFFDWWDGGQDKNCKVILDVPAVDGGRILSGAFKLPSFQLTGNRGEKANVSISVASSGPVTKTNNT